MPSEATYFSIVLFACWQIESMLRLAEGGEGVGGKRERERNSDREGVNPWLHKNDETHQELTWQLADVISEPCIRPINLGKLNITSSGALQLQRGSVRARVGHPSTFLSAGYHYYHHYYYYFLYFLLLLRRVTQMSTIAKIGHRRSDEALPVPSSGGSCNHSKMMAHSTRKKKTQQYIHISSNNNIDNSWWSWMKWNCG